MAEQDGPCAERVRGREGSTRAASDLLRQFRLAFLRAFPLAAGAACSPVSGSARSGRDPRAAERPVHAGESLRRSRLSRASIGARLRAALWLGVDADASGRIGAA